VVWVSRRGSGPDGQSRLPAEVAGAFLNIEPLVGAVAGVVVFGNPAGPAQLGGGAAILGDIALSSVRRPGRRTASPGIAAPAVAQHAVAERALVEQAVAGAAPRSAKIGTQLSQIPNFLSNPEVQQPQGLSASTQVSPLLPDLRPRLGLAYVGPL
jgi:hypothetical protein